MLVQFTVKNFRTFKDKATLSLVASSYDKSTRETENLTEISKYKLRLLKSAVVFGANASGKTKLHEALRFMRHFVVSSLKESIKGESIPVEPFRLNLETDNQASEFEVIFIYQDILYRYGFEVDRKKIISEWLFYKPKTKEVTLFYREEDTFETHDRVFQKGKSVINEGLVRNNALLLTVAAQFNEATCISVMDWFYQLRFILNTTGVFFQQFSIYKSKDLKFKDKIVSLLKKADIGIQSYDIKKNTFNEQHDALKGKSQELRNIILKDIKESDHELYADIDTIHKKYDSNKTPVENVYFSMRDDESSGTQQFFALAGPIIDVLENGYTLLVDELDIKLHPNLVNKIVALFNSKENNPKNAQLIFNAHDTNLLSSGLLRRDQIWFTQKNQYGEAQLYSLADFKTDSVRKNELFEENYIKGKYGAVPYLSFFDSIN
ncbi:MAG: ATP-binding protein [Alphaproteobacteria bacterium]|nr:ATP-binding protein [Alphaproteobacteria bacterium]